MGRERPRHQAPKAAPAPPTRSLTPHLSVSLPARALLRAVMRSVSDSRPEPARVARTLLLAMCGSERLTASGKSRRCSTGRSTLRMSLFESASRASRLPYVPSALRGLDPRLALPMVRATVGASAEQASDTCHRPSPGSVEAERQSPTVLSRTVFSKRGDARKLVCCRRSSASPSATSFRSAARPITPSVPYACRPCSLAA